MLEILLLTWLIVKHHTLVLTSCLGNASKYIALEHCMHEGPVRWNDCFPGPFVQWPYWGIFFSAKPTHSHVVFTLWVYIPTHLSLSHPFCSHWTNLPGKLLEVTSQSNCLTHTMYAKAFKVACKLCRHWRFELILSHAETCHVFLKTILLMLF